MHKNGLTGAKARIKTLEQEADVLRQIIDHNNQQSALMVNQLEQKVTELSQSGKAALNHAQQAVCDLQSVNAELVDSLAETQQQRNKAQKERYTYRAAFFVLLTVAILCTAVDAIFYWSVLS